MDGFARFQEQLSFTRAFPTCFVAEPKHATYSARTPAVLPRSSIDAELLSDSISDLRLALSVITVAIAALRRQNADNDADVADVLERYASDRLDIQIEKLEKFTAILRTSSAFATRRKET